MTVDEIRTLAEECSHNGKAWHFHILTPECQLNSSGKHTLVLENATDRKEYVVYSDTPFMDIGKILVTLLHGNDVVKGETEINPSPPSEMVEKMIIKAKELMAKGFFWHHHMLFPGCKFNTHGDKWVIVFEDKEKEKIIKSISDDEPKNDLQYIEGLFYSQKK